MDTTKIKYGVTRITQSCFSFFAGTVGKMFGLVLVFVGILLLVENRKLLAAGITTVATPIINVVTSISFTQWLLIVLVFIVWKNNVVGKRILDKLKDIESAMVTKHHEDER